ncbi:3-oxoacyl-ACP reductase, partial [Burkholderia multivorans]
LSGKSAYVDGQFLTVGSGAGTAATDAQFLATGTDGPLAGRTAVVTGAARGIGAEVARVLARDGAHIIGVDMPQAGQALAQVINAVGGKSLQLDITPDRAARTVAHTAGARRDILIHN